MKKTNHYYINNLTIHSDFGMRPDFFLKNLGAAKYIRTYDTEIFSPYITSQKEYDNLRNLYNAHKENIFNGEDLRNVISIQIPNDLHFWFSIYSFDEIEKMIIAWLACSSFGEEDIMEKQLHMDIVHKINEFFKSREIQNDKSDSFEVRQKYYDDFLNENGWYSPLKGILGNVIKNECLNDQLNFDIRYSYFSDADHDQIMKGRNKDSFNRTESESEPFNVWLYEYRRHHFMDLSEIMSIFESMISDITDQDFNEKMFKRYIKSMSERFIINNDIDVKMKYDYKLEPDCPNCGNELENAIDGWHSDDEGEIRYMCDNCGYCGEGDHYSTPLYDTINYRHVLKIKKLENGNLVQDF